jgi:hypothetical protein
VRYMSDVGARWVLSRQRTCTALCGLCIGRDSEIFGAVQSTRNRKNTEEPKGRNDQQMNDNAMQCRCHKHTHITGTALTMFAAAVVAALGEDDIAIHIAIIAADQQR